VDTVKLTIDGIEVDAPKGALVIRAAEQIGISIPRFCDHPLLAPAGACRQVPGRRGGPAQAGGGRARSRLPTAWSCDPDDLRSGQKAQEGIMEFLLINHPLDCPVCDKGGECPLQNQAMSNGQAESRFVEHKRSSRSRCRSAPRSCSTASGACCASAAPGSPTRSPATSSST
jgi:NADH-quinone oxidoreductase subunit G